MTSRLLKQCLFAIVLLAGFSLNASAAGLGKASIDSKLGYPFKANLTLYGLHNLAPEQIRLTLASPENFKRLGIENKYFLSQLKFKVGAVENGKAQVEITSQDAVHEPFIEFALQLEWPQGEVVKGYTFLLEPKLQK